MNSKLIDICKYLFGAKLDSQLGVTGYNGNLLLKTISTPLVRSAILAVVLVIITLLAFIFAPTQFWMNVFGIVLLVMLGATVLFVLGVPLFKPKVAESDIQAMFFIFVGLVRESMELPTQTEGESIVDVNLEQPTQPVTMSAKASIAKPAKQPKKK